MKRITTHMLVLIALLALAVSILSPLAGGTQPAAAGGSWSAWIYNPNTGELVHVFPDGAAPVSMMFPLPPGSGFELPTEVAISRDGALLAACLYDPNGSYGIYVYDIYNGVFTAAYLPPGPSIGCSLGRYAFSPDGSELAFGILNHFWDTADPRPDWEVFVMQTNTSLTTHYIASNSAAIVALGNNYRGMLPFVTAFETGVIAFKPVRWGTEGASEYDSLVWQLDGSNSVSIVGPYGKSSLDMLIPNGEAVWVEERNDLPKGFLEGPGFLFNSVMYSNKMGDVFPIFNNGASILYGARFVDDGRKIAVQSYTAPGPEVWMYVDRNGASGPLPADIQSHELWGTLDGYVFLNDNNPGGPQVRYHRFAGGAIPTAHIAWQGVPGGYWRIIWVNPLAGGNGLPPFPDITPAGSVVPVSPRLLTPVPQLVLTPQIRPLVTVAPLGTPFRTIPTLQPLVLRIGGRARVHTTEGDLLRVRSGAGTNYGVQFQIPDGTQVTVLEGPVNASTFNWWFIRTEDGRSGWVVEGVPESGGFLQTLVPLP